MIKNYVTLRCSYILASAFILGSFNLWGQQIKSTYNHYKYINPQGKEFNHPNTPSVLTMTDDKVNFTQWQNGKKIEMSFLITKKTITDRHFDDQDWKVTECRVKWTDDSGITGEFVIALLKPKLGGYEKSRFIIIEADSGQMHYTNK